MKRLERWEVSALILISGTLFSLYRHNKNNAIRLARDVFNDKLGHDATAISESLIALYEQKKNIVRKNKKYFKAIQQFLECPYSRRYGNWSPRNTSKIEQGAEIIDRKRMIDLQKRLEEYIT